MPGCLQRKESGLIVSVGLLFDHLDNFSGAKSAIKDLTQELTFYTRCMIIALNYLSPYASIWKLISFAELLNVLY